MEPNDHDHYNNDSCPTVTVTNTDVTTTTSTSTTSISTSSTLPKLPHWHIPQPTHITFPMTGLKMYNSLTRQKELFIPMHGTKHITWYM